jgi:hypothetical protein
VSYFGAIQLVDENGTPFGVKQVDGKPRVSSMPYTYDIAEGNIEGHTVFSKLGYGVIGTGGGEVWGPGTAYVFPAAAAGMEVVSSSANDASAGTGVQTVRIYYLTNTYVEKTTDVTLNGTTAVATTALDIFRVNNFRALTVGANAVAAGTIDVRAIADTPIYSRILAGNTRARNAVYTVPVGKNLYINFVTIGASKGSTVGNVAIFTSRATYDDKRSVSLTAGTFFMPYFEMQAVDGTIIMPLESPIKIPATVDTKMSCVPAQAATICTCSLRGWLETA